MRLAVRVLRSVICSSLLLTATAATGFAAPLISEFIASNGATVADQDGDYADWLEIYNPDSTTVDLTGWYLTNKANNLTKWKIPALTLKGGASVVIFCSSKNYTDPAKPLATNFNLSDSGGYVALVQADGTTVVSSYNFPAQYLDVSYGTSVPANSSEQATVGYFTKATPGAVNGGLGTILLSDRVTISKAAGLFTGSVSVTLTGATGGEKIRYVLAAPSSAGDAIDPPTASSTLYTGPITVSSSALLRAAVFAADDSQRGLPASAAYVQVDNSTSQRLDTFSSAMPVIVFDNNGFGPLTSDDLYHPGWIGAFRPKSGAVSLLQQPDFFDADTMKLHGSSSATWPKQSYNIDLADDLGADVSESFFGLDSSKSWVSVASWYYDRSYIRNSFVYSLSRAMGYWAPATKLAEMFIHNGTGPLDMSSYAGIVTLTDRLKVNKNRINIYSLDITDLTAPNVTGGYVLKVDHPDPDDFSWTTTQGVTVVVDTPGPDELMKEQGAYIMSYVQQMEDAMVADRASSYATRNYLSYLDRPSWVDYHLLNVLVENDDAFQSSEYFNKDVNGPLKAGPVWDYDRSLGSADGRDGDPSRWTPLNEDHDYWDIGWWSYLTHDPEFMQAWIDRWQTLRHTTLSDASLLGLIDSTAAGVSPEAAARDAARWPDNVGRYGDGWPGEIAHMKLWLAQRTAWIDSQFVAAPTVVDTGSSLVITPPAGAQVAYTLTGTDPRQVGGALSSTTILSDGPVTLSKDNVIVARSYNASQATAYPGSPWSSSVSSSGALTGQLTNVSCRTEVGTDADVLVAGFVVTGNSSDHKQVLIRGVGPTLASYGVGGVLAHPVLSIYDSKQNVVATNQGWSTNTNSDAIVTTAHAVGAFDLPDSSDDSALLLSLAPGVYSAQVAGLNSTTGNGLVEVYQVSEDNSHVANVSSRALVNGNTGPLITGFVIREGPAQVLVRGIGPTLANYGVPSVLAQPVLELYDSNSNLIATNSGWSTSANAALVAAAAAKVGAFALPTGSADSALLLTLPPGVYSMHVVAGTTGTGDALAECYLVPPN